MFNTDKDAKTEAYQQYQKVVYSICWKFYKKYGGNLSEIFAEANKLFLVAFNSFDPSKSKLSTWLHTKIYGGLICYRNQTECISKQRHITKIITVEDLTLYEKPYDQFILDELYDELLGDSLLVAKLFFNPPSDFINFSYELSVKLNYTKTRTKKVISLYLSEKKRWNQNRITNAFNQLKEKLESLI
jgi:hypothetical protein